jgi:hypothetical protein
MSFVHIDLFSLAQHFRIRVLFLSVYAQLRLLFTLRFIASTSTTCIGVTGHLRVYKLVSQGNWYYRGFLFTLVLCCQPCTCSVLPVISDNILHFNITYYSVACLVGWSQDEEAFARKQKGCKGNIRICPWCTPSGFPKCVYKVWTFQVSWFRSYSVDTPPHTHIHSPSFIRHFWQSLGIRALYRVMQHISCLQFISCPIYSNYNVQKQKLISALGWLQSGFLNQFCMRYNAQTWIYTSTPPYAFMA